MVKSRLACFVALFVMGPSCSLDVVTQPSVMPTGKPKQESGVAASDPQCPYQVWKSEGEYDFGFCFVGGDHAHERCKYYGELLGEPCRILSDTKESVSMDLYVIQTLENRDFAFILFMDPQDCCQYLDEMKLANGWQGGCDMPNRPTDDWHCNPGYSLSVPGDIAAWATPVN